MKEIKTFFGKNNKLNKGYVNTPNVQENDNAFYQKKFAHILPPIDMINELEDIHPGTLAKLMDMAEREQHHRQALDLVNLDSQTRSLKTARYFALMFMVVTCFTTIALVIVSGAMMGIVFAAISFSAISAISLIPIRKNFKKPEFEPGSAKNNHYATRKKIRR